MLVLDHITDSAIIKHKGSWAQSHDCFVGQPLRHLSAVHLPMANLATALWKSLLGRHGEQEIGRPIVMGSGVLLVSSCQAPTSPPHAISSHHGLSA